MSKGTLYVIAAPSGAGKTSLVTALVKTVEDLHVSVSHTTRDKREGEEDGVNYHFVPMEVFTQMVDEGAFFEHAEVFGNFYGTARQTIEASLQQNRDIILEIDWQGAQQVRAAIPDCISVFILPPSRGALYERLVQRNQDEADVIQTRMDSATEEMSHYDEFDYIIKNEYFEKALEGLRAIVLAKRLEREPQIERHQALIKELLRT